MADIRGFFLGYDHDDDINQLAMRWFGIAFVFGAILIVSAFTYLLLRC